jgi:hypothetical protein
VTPSCHRSSQQRRNDEGAIDSDEECVVAAERNNKHQTRAPKDHFNKHLEAICPHHSYPVKHKLKDCTLIKKFMMSGAFSKDRKSGGDPGREKRGTHSQGSGGHDNVRPTPPQTRERYMTS